MDARALMLMAADAQAAGGNFPAWDLNENTTPALLDAIAGLQSSQADEVATFGSVSGTYKWYGGVLAPNGKIYGIPYNPSTILKIDPETDTATTLGSLSGTSKWIGGVLAPNGKIYGIPYNSSTILKIDPETDTATTLGSLSGTSKWIGGVLAPNGKIYGIPANASTVLSLLSELPVDPNFPLHRALNKF